MEHKPEVVEAKQVNNEQVSYKIVCCGDETESSWHTIHVKLPDHMAWLEERKKEVAERHEAMVQWRIRWNSSKKS